MLDLRLKTIGTLTMDENGMHAEGFEADGPAMCREVGALALMWAIGELQKELTEIIARPGGTGKCGVD